MLTTLGGRVLLCLVAKHLEGQRSHDPSKISSKTHIFGTYTYWNLEQTEDGIDIVKMGSTIFHVEFINVFHLGTQGETCKTNDSDV